jgi:hypothetical protein
MAAERALAPSAAPAAADGAFDAAQFESALSLQALRVSKTEVHELCTVLRRLGALFDKPRLRSVMTDDAAPDVRLVLLHETAQSAGACKRRGARRSPAALTCTSTDLDGLPAAAKLVIQERHLVPVPYTLRLTYEYWPAEHVLKVRTRGCWGGCPTALTCSDCCSPGAPAARLRGACRLRNGRPYCAPEPARRVAAFQARHRPRASRQKHAAHPDRAEQGARARAPHADTRPHVDRPSRWQVGTIESEFRVPHFEVIAGDPCLEVCAFGPRVHCRA